MQWSYTKGMQRNPTDHGGFDAPSIPLSAYCSISTQTPLWSMSTGPKLLLLLSFSCLYNIHTKRTACWLGGNTGTYTIEGSNSSTEMWMGLIHGTSLCCLSMVAYCINNLSAISNDALCTFGTGFTTAFICSWLQVTSRMWIRGGEQRRHDDWGRK